ncbi:hypothetical protein HDU91_007351, partial [Kappamyces sp. JEL0680]
MSSDGELAGLIWIVPSTLSMVGCALIITTMNLPRNSFKSIIRLLMSCDLLLAALSLPMALLAVPTATTSEFLVILYLAGKFIFDWSFYLSLSISLIAFYIVKLRGSIEMVSWPVLATLSLLPGSARLLVSVLLDSSEHAVANWWINMINAMIQSV